MVMQCVQQGEVECAAVLPPLIIRYSSPDHAVINPEVSAEYVVNWTHCTTLSIKHLIINIGGNTN